MSDSAEVPDAAESGARRTAPQSWWRTAAAIAWLFGFFLLFYSVTPPNNPTGPRYNFWPQVPLKLLDAVDPPEDPLRIPSGWTYFPQRFDLIATAAVILVGAWALGHLCLRAIRLPLPARCVDRTVFAFGLGLAALSLLTLACGMAGWLSREFFVTLIAAAVIAECALRFRGRHRADEQPAAADAYGERVTYLKLFCLWTIAPFLLAMFLGSMLPSTDFDVREYHLQGPKEFFQSGRITFLPHNVYTSFPFLTEMLSLLAMVLRGDWYLGALAGKLVLMCFVPLTGLALFAAGRRWHSRQAGWLAALVFLTMPWAFRISIIAYAEGGLTFYLFASLLAVGIAVEKSRGAETGANRLVLPCGLLAGSAMACKYTGLVSVVIPLFIAACLAPVVRLRVRRPDALRMIARIAALFLLGTTITIGPWLVKNVVETGNPVYPLMYTLFGGRDWDAELNAKWRGGHSPDNYSDLPQRAFEVIAGNDWLTPLLFGLAPLWLLSSNRKRFPGYLWLYLLWLFFTWWALTHRIDRFWVPMTPVFALLAGIGAASITGRAWQIACGFAVVAAVTFNLALVVSGAAGNNAFLADLDRAQRPPPGIAFLNSSLPRPMAEKAGPRVLMVGEAQVFDAEFPLVYTTVFDHSIFEQWTAAGGSDTPHEQRPLRSADDIRRKLREEGITHVFVNWQEIQRYRTTYGYTKFVVPEKFDALVDRGVLSAPTTLAVVLDTPLWQRVTSRQEQFRARRIRLARGDELLVYNVHREFGTDVRQELKSWGDRLLTETEGRKLFITGQIYRVLP